MRPIIKHILVQGGLLLGLHTAAVAGPILVVTNGSLMGAKGLEINGSHYDVTFSDTRPLAANLLFDTFSESYAAADALDRLVFQGLYDTSPGLTNGCSNRVSCSIVTAFEIGWPGIAGTAFTNTATRYLDVTTLFPVLGNGANAANVTFAHWTLQVERQAVPEPSSLLLAGVGLAALVASRRRGAALA